jgi:hypothetical protein
MRREDRCFCQGKCSSPSEQLMSSEGQLIGPYDDADRDYDADSEDTFSELEDDRTFIRWLYHLEYNLINPVRIFQHPFSEIFTPYPFQRKDEVTYIRTPAFQQTLKASFPTRIEEVYLYHFHMSGKNPSHYMVEFFTKILGGFLYFESRHGVCGCESTSDDHINLTRLYFGMTREHILAIANISMRKECWTGHAAEHLLGDCYRTLQPDKIVDEEKIEVGSISDMSELEMLKSDPINDEEEEYETHKMRDARQKRNVARMFTDYWHSRDIQ